VYGEEFTAWVVVRCRGEGVRGIRPPAVREEKRPLWDLSGVDTATDAIVSVCMMYDSRVVSWGKPFGSVDVDADVDV
jgi:hypothetical protein